jgi:hypothetical protein
MPLPLFFYCNNLDVHNLHILHLYHTHTRVRFYTHAKKRLGCVTSGPEKRAVSLNVCTLKFLKKIKKDVITGFKPWWIAFHWISLPLDHVPMPLPLGDAYAVTAAAGKCRRRGTRPAF